MGGSQEAGFLSHVPLPGNIEESTPNGTIELK